MPQLFEQLLTKLIELIEEFQMNVVDIPVLSAISQWPIEQCFAVLGLAALFIFILVPCIIVGLTVSLPKHLRVNTVKKFYSINDLSKFKVVKMGKAGSKYYYAEGVNTFRLAMPRWKFADSYGAREPRKFFNKVIWEESVLWLHIRNKVYILSTKDPWEMVYLVHTLRESGVDVLACKQEMDKQEQIESSKPSTDEFIQGMIARMEKLFADCPEALDNTLELAEKCNVELKLNEVNLPKYEIPKRFANASEYMVYLAKKGFNNHFGGTEHEKDPVYLERFDYEIKMIQQMGFESYFIIVWDFIDYCRKHDIYVGPGRGSAAGSLVAYCLGITDVDPIKYNLLFERFLNPERVSWPD